MNGNSKLFQHGLTVYGLLYSHTFSIVSASTAEQPDKIKPNQVLLRQYNNNIYQSKTKSLLILGRTQLWQIPSKKSVVFSALF